MFGIFCNSNIHFKMVSYSSRSQSTQNFSVGLEILFYNFMTKSTKHSLKCSKFDNKKNMDFPNDLKMLKWFNVHHFIHSNTLTHQKEKTLYKLLLTVLVRKTNNPKITTSVTHCDVTNMLTCPLRFTPMIPDDKSKGCSNEDGHR